MKMNRRGFFKALAATAVIAFADKTRLADAVLPLISDPVAIGRSYVEALARSMIETKETLAANIMNRSFS